MSDTSYIQFKHMVKRGTGMYVGSPTPSPHFNWNSMLQIRYLKLCTYIRDPISTP